MRQQNAICCPNDDDRLWKRASFCKSIATTFHAEPAVIVDHITAGSGDRSLRFVF